MLVNQLPNLNCGPLKGNNRELNFNGTHSIQDLQDLRRYINEDGTVKNEEFLDHLKTKLDDEAQDKKGKGDLSTYGKNPLAIMVTFMAASLFMRGSFWADKVLIKAIAKKVMTETPESVKGLSGKIAEKLAPASDKANGIRGKISSFFKSVHLNMDNFFKKDSDSIMSDVKEFIKIRKKLPNDIKPSEAASLSKQIDVLTDTYYYRKFDSHSNETVKLDFSFGKPVRQNVEDESFVSGLSKEKIEDLVEKRVNEAKKEIKAIIDRLAEFDKIKVGDKDELKPKKDRIFNSVGNFFDDPATSEAKAEFPEINIANFQNLKKNLNEYVNKSRQLKNTFKNSEMSDDMLRDEVKVWNNTMKLGDTINKYTGRLFDALSVITGLYAVRIYQKTDSIRDAVEFKPPTDDNKMIEEYKLEEIEAQIKKTELDMDRIKNRKELNSKIAEKAQQLEELKAEKAKLVKA